MRLFRFGESGRERPGAFDRDGIARDISSLIGDLANADLSRTSIARVRAADLTALPRVADGVRLGACVAGTRNFIGVGLNYADHAKESGAEVPTEPALFNKAPSCISGPDDAIHLPPGSQKTDWEVELAIVIGERAWCLAPAQAHEAIAGFCICHDVSERAYQLERCGQWMKGKGCPTFGPLGPWLVTPDEIADVQALPMWLEVDGQRMQNGSTSTMVFGVHHLVWYISHFIALEPGDVITTGTPPGVGLGMKPPRYLVAGNEVRLGIKGLGEQRQRVVASSIE